MKIQRSTGDNGMMSIIKGGNAIHGPLLKQDLCMVFYYAHAEAVENVAGATLQRRENVLCTFIVYSLGKCSKCSRR